MIPVPRYRVGAPGRSVEMVDTSPAQPPPLTPEKALVKLFLDNADNDRHAENDALVEELLKRRRAIQALAIPGGRGGVTTAG